MDDLTEDDNTLGSMDSGTKEVFSRENWIRMASKEEFYEFMS